MGQWNADNLIRNVLEFYNLKNDLIHVVVGRKSGIYYTDRYI